MYYRLKPEVYLIYGEKKAIITNILSGDIISLNQETLEIIEKAETNGLFTEKNDVMEKLVTLNWADIKDKPVFVEKVRFTNSFTKRRAWKYLPKIEVLVLQLTSKCNKPCGAENCNRDIFCPMCIQLEGSHNELAFSDWQNIIDKFYDLSPNNIILTGGNPLLHKDFHKIYNYIQKRFNNVIVHINDIDQISSFTHDQPVYTTLFNEINIKKYNLIRNKDNIVAFYEGDKAVKQGIMVNLGEPKIKKDTFKRKVNLASYFTRVLYDNCLIGKVTVLMDGSVVPCLGCADIKLGNLFEEDLQGILRKLYYDYWAVSVDSRDNQKCSKCEFRYNCLSCRKYKDENCHYDVMEGIWR